MNLTLLNLVTAIIVENVLEISRAEERNKMKEEEKKHKALLLQLKSLFHEIDSDESEEITIEELRDALDTNQVAGQTFHDLEIPFHEAEVMFALLDLDGSGSVSVDEFVEGALRIGGAAKGKHLLAVQYDMNKMWIDMTARFAAVQQHLGMAPDLGSRPASAILGQNRQDAQGGLKEDGLLRAVRDLLATELGSFKQEVRARLDGLEKRFEELQQDVSLTTNLRK